MNRYIEAKPAVTAVQFWNNEKCMLELKELGISKIELSIVDGVTRIVIPNALIGRMEAQEGDYIILVADADGMIVVAPKARFEEKYRIYEASEESDESKSNTVKPTFESTENRLLNAFPRPDALNEIYSTGDVDHRGVPVNYSIQRGDHSIMGMTGILFEKGFIEEDDYQEGVEDTDLLEMVHDRLLSLNGYIVDGSEIGEAILAVADAIRCLLRYRDRCRESSED